MAGPRIEQSEGECSKTVVNLVEAIKSIEGDLIDSYGVKAISMKEVARAKSAGEPRPEHVEVMIKDDDIIEISLARLELIPWKYVSETPGSVHVICWKEPGNHLSGSASVEQFANRILYAIENPEARVDRDLPA